jgi:hypothetical protein
MSRRRKKPAPAYWIDWTPEIAGMFDVFRVLTRGMDAPGRVRVYRGDRHVTVLARFTSAEGLCATAKVKVETGR